MKQRPDPKHEHVWVPIDGGAVCAGPDCDVTLSDVEATYLSQTKEKERLGSVWIRPVTQSKSLLKDPVPQRFWWYKTESRSAF